MNNISKAILIIFLSSIWFSGITISDGITISQLLGVIYSIFWVINRTLQKRRSKTIQLAYYYNSNILFSINVFLLVSVISIVYASYTYLAITSIKTMLMNALMMAFIIDNIITIKDYLIIYRSITYSGILSTILAVTKAAGVNILGLVELHKKALDNVLDNSDIRRYGFFDDPNFAAQSMIIILILTIFLYLFSNNQKEKLVLRISVLIELIAIIFTNSRGGFLTLCAIILVLIKHLKISSKNIMLVIIFLATISIVMLNVHKYNRLKSLSLLLTSNDIASSDSSIKLRVAAINAGIAMYLKNPILGVGIGNSPMWNIEYGTDMLVAGHNMYLTIMCEVGTIGLLIFFYSIAKLIRSMKIAERIIINRLHYIASSLKISIYSFLISSLFLSSLHIKIFWVLLALSVSLTTIMKKNTRQAVFLRGHGLAKLTSRV